MRVFKRYLEQNNIELKNASKHPKLMTKLAMMFSNRIDTLERFISEKTEYDGRKVGMI